MSQYSRPPLDPTPQLQWLEDAIDALLGLGVALVAGCCRALLAACGLGADPPHDHQP